MAIIEANNFFFLECESPTLTPFWALIYENHYTHVEHCMFKVNNRNTRKMCEICLNLTIKSPEGRKIGQNTRNF